MQREFVVAHVQLQRIEPAAAADRGSPADHEHIVPLAAAQHIVPAVADQRIVPGAADDDVVPRCPGQRVVVFVAQMRHDTGKIAAEDEIALAGVGTSFSRRSIGPGRPDEKIVEAVAVHIAGMADPVATAVRIIDPDNHQSAATLRLSGRQRPQVQRRRQTHIAEDDVADPLVAGGLKSSDNIVIGAVSVDVAATRDGRATTLEEPAATIDDSRLPQAGQV